jgi:hypothetical protein
LQCVCKDDGTTAIKIAEPVYEEPPAQPQVNVADVVKQLEEKITKRLEEKVAQTQPQVDMNALNQRSCLARLS